MDEPTTDAAPERLELDAEERRVIGTLIEKGLTSPTTYPMSVNSLLTGCNQKSNRDPITHFVEEQIERVCQRLMPRGFVTRFAPGDGGRVERYRQEFGRTFELRGVELAVLGELLLRGPQSVGDLRQRASRMREIANLDELQAILDKLAAHAPPLVLRLSPEGAVRGVRYTHACYPEAELREVLEEERSGAASSAAHAPARGGAAPAAGGMAALQARVDQLEERLRRIEESLGIEAPEIGPAGDAEG